MRPGTPGFLGERLREAREARGITGIALADLVEVSRQAISQYENGSATPGPDILARIAQQLNVDESFFWRTFKRAPTGTLFYRSLASATKAARTRAERRFGWLKEIVAYIEEFVELPEADIPDAKTDPLHLSFDDVERIASEVRKAFGIPGGPVPNLAVLLENMGVLVSRFELGAPTLDAFSEWSEESHRPYFVLSSDKNSAVRSRMDAAHELGHAVLHRRVTADQLRDKHVFNYIEAQAFRFAAAFLLPADEFSDDFFYPTVAELRRLKEKWRTAMSMIVKRCADLELLPEKEITRLYIAVGRKRELLDDELEPEQPRSLRDSFELIVNEGVQTRAQIRESLPFSNKDVEDLACLPAGFLEDPKPGVVVELKAKPTSAEPGERGQLLPFPKKP
jgi:Zn-dependent peptidase ImmA (M78 family)/transcriptional regulator with XRE-family HTH domain